MKGDMFTIGGGFMLREALCCKRRVCARLICAVRGNYVPGKVDICATKNDLGRGRRFMP